MVEFYSNVTRSQRIVMQNQSKYKLLWTQNSTKQRKSLVEEVFMVSYLIKVLYIHKNSNSDLG